MTPYRAFAKSTLIASSAALLLVLTTTPAASQAPAATAAFTDSTAAGLSATKRVAISSVIVSFQASTAGIKAQGNGMLADKNSAKAVLSMTDMDEGLQDQIVAEAYRQLKADLAAAGFEVVPEAEVTGNATYKQIITLAGTPNHTKFANGTGDAMLVGPQTLQPYLPYGAESARFSNPVSHIGWVGGMGGKSVTPGGPSSVTMGSTWKLPGLEVQMAKELNAQVVKAFYVVTLGEATANRQRDRIATANSTGIESGTGAARAQVGLMADQTRIAFRSPNGNNKWQKVSPNKPLPAKDGDVVVRLANDLDGSSDFFKLASSSRLGGGLLNPGADFQFKFEASLTNPARYKAEVQAMIATADKAMTALVRR